MMKSGKRKSIRQKIFLVFVAVSAISLLISGGIAVMGMLGLRNAAADGNSAIGTQAAETGGEALIRQALDDITALSSVKAALIDGEMAKTGEALELLADYLSHLHQNPGRYLLLPFSHCRFNTGLKREMQWMLSPGMTAVSTGTEHDLIEAGVLEETYLHGNMEILYETAMNQNQSISSIYTTGASGVNTGYDDKSLTKITEDVSEDVADLRGTAWYLEAERGLKTHVTDTYRDRFGRGLCVTLSTPYYGADGKFAGVIGLDMLIRDLSENVLQSSVGETGYAVLLNVHTDVGAKVIAAPGMDESNEDDMELFLGSHWETVLESMRNDPLGVTESELAHGESVYIVWSPVTMTGWTFAFIMPEGEIAAPSAQIRDMIGSMTEDVIRDTGARIAVTAGMLAALLLMVLVLTGFAAARISKHITDPIMALASDVKNIGDGNLDYTSSVKTSDEIEDLSLSFQRMTVELKEYIRNLARVTADKERIGAELNVATHIQASMLPSIFPAFPDRTEFDIYGSMQPAKEVGGDFYDFFLVDKDTLALVMADVSGKGVPAALFMVIAKTLLKNNAQYGKSPKEVFDAVNNILCENNDTGMFVTVFMGYLDIPSGKLTYVNAGHNAPLLRSGGQFAWLRSKPGFVLAGMEDISYRQHEAVLQPGDELFLYTDGITEAVNRENQLFGDPRLLEAANHFTDLPLHEFTVSIKREIDKFANGADQADDITMLIIRYKGFSDE